MPPKILRNLKIDDVSSVDVGAGRGVKVVMAKRDASQQVHERARKRFIEERQGRREFVGFVVHKHRDGVPTIYNKPITFGADLSAEALAYLKREFTQDERDARAKNKHALPDGSFPIDNEEDLHDAVQAIGRAKNPAKAKAHIKTRAAALGATDKLPDDWKKRFDKGTVLKLVDDAVQVAVEKKAQDFSAASQAMDDCDDASELMCEVRDAVHALDCSINSILCDDTVSDKGAAITTSYEQFKTYVGGLALEDDDDADDKTEKRDMTTATPTLRDIEAMIAKAVGAKDEVITKLSDEIVYLKMSDKQKAYHDGLGSDTDKKKFSSMTSDERDAEMEKTRKSYEDSPVFKAMAKQNDDLQKRLAVIEGERDLEVCKRDAAKMGLTETDAAEVLMKSRKGDAEAHRKLETYMMNLAKRHDSLEKSSKVFEEFGTSRGNGGETGDSAHGLIMAKAQELRAKNPDLTEAQAYDKAYNDPANREIRAREVQERMAKIHRVA